MHRRTLLLIVALGTGLGPGRPLVAQSCTLGPSFSLAGGYVSHKVNGGTTGVAFGADAMFTAPPALLEAGYRRVQLEGEAANPDVLLGRITFPAAAAGPLAVCGVVHAAVTRFAFENDSGAIAAGGVGVMIAPGVPGIVRPYVSVRGLGARATGTVLGLEVDATGWSVGVEAGASLAVGPIDLRITGALDGFDDGLGVTPYPAQTVELAVTFRL